MYQDYARAIRKEYGHYSDVDYWRGRRAVLEKLMSKAKLYNRMV